MINSEVNQLGSAVRGSEGRRELDIWPQYPEYLSSAGSKWPHYICERIFSRSFLLSRGTSCLKCGFMGHIMLLNSHNVYNVSVIIIFSLCFWKKQLIPFTAKMYNCKVYFIVPL